MKTFLFLILLFANSCMYAQNSLQLDTLTNRYFFQKTYNNIPQKPDTIYFKAKNYLRKGNESSGITNEEPGSGFTITRLFTLKISFTKNSAIIIPVLADWTIEIKPGKYRLTVSNIVITNNTKGYGDEQTLYGYCSVHLPALMGKRKLEKIQQDVINKVKREIKKQSDGLYKYIIEPRHEEW